MFVVVQRGRWCVDDDAGTRSGDHDSRELLGDVVLSPCHEAPYGVAEPFGPASREGTLLVDQDERLSTRFDFKIEIPVPANQLRD
jgi:hypothetical protein